MDSLKDLLNPAQIEQYENRIAAEMPAGYGTFHHPKMVHGSYENRSDRPRRAFVINVFADGTCSDTDEEILSGVPVIKKDQKMEGQFFPLLYTQK